MVGLGCQKVGLRGGFVTILVSYWRSSGELQTKISTLELLATVENAFASAASYSLDIQHKRVQPLKI